MIEEDPDTLEEDLSPAKEKAFSKKKFSNDVLLQITPISKECLSKTNLHRQQKSNEDKVSIYNTVNHQ